MPGRRQDIQRRLKRAAENSQNIAEIFKKQKIESSDSQTQESSSDTDFLASRRPSSADRSRVHGANASTVVNNDGLSCVPGTSPAVCGDFPTVPRTSSPDCDNFVVPSSKKSNPCPVASSNHEELQNDLGIFIQANKPVKDVIATISRMSDGQKYHLLKSHDRPSHHYTFPIRLVGGTMRSFRLQWLDEHAWLVYSRKIDGAFLCVLCLICKS